MLNKIIMLISFGILCLSISSCLYRGDGIFKKIGDSDYRARLDFMNLVAVADGRPTYVCGYVILDNHISPVKNTHLVLKKKGQQEIVSNTYTDHIGKFSMSGILSKDSYVIEIDSLEYQGNYEIVVEPNRNNFHEIIAHKR